jgi:hypothetical protein
VEDGAEGGDGGVRVVLANLARSRERRHVVVGGALELGVRDVRARGERRADAGLVRVDLRGARDVRGREDVRPRGVPPVVHGAEEREHLRGVPAAAEDDHGAEGTRGPSGARGEGRARDVRDAQRDVGEDQADEDERETSRVSGRVGRPHAQTRAAARCERGGDSQRC